MQYNRSLERLYNILAELREKCPWDKKQTLSSLRPQTIEELYELTDAIDEKNWNSLKEELGDLLLHVLFYSRIAEEEEQFSIWDVMESVSNKLVKRHPHIYDTVQVRDETDVKRNWEQNKLKEGKISVLDGIPKSSPALTKASVIQAKAKSIGFDWEETGQVLAKVKEEIAELEAGIVHKDQDNIEEEIGDVLFSIINLSRFLHTDAERCLEKSNQKFIRRFKTMEALARESSKQLADLTLAEMDLLWNEAKRQNAI